MGIKLKDIASINISGSSNKLGTVTIGSSTKPMYLNNGVATECSYTLGKSVPSNAIFTDTTYSAGTGLSLSGTTLNHASSVTAGTAGTSSDTSGSTLAVPYVTVNASGHVTGYGTHTHTITGFASSSHSHRYLPLDGSGELTGDLSIRLGDSDKFLIYDYDGDRTAGASWRIGCTGTGSGETNYFRIQSGTADQSKTEWLDALYIGQNSLTVNFATTPCVANSKVSLEGHTHSYLPLSGGTMNGKIFMGGINSTSSPNTTSQIVWGSNGAAISSNGNNVIINPSQSSTSGQIILTPGSSANISVNGSMVSLNGHTHNYLPLSGGTLTGEVTMSASNTSDVIYWSNATNKGYKIGFGVGTSSNRGIYDQTNGWVVRIDTSNVATFAGTSEAANYVTRDRGVNTVTTLASLPVTKSVVTASLSSATNISLASAMNIGESITVICTPSASFTQPIPTSGSFKSMDGSSLSVTSGKDFEINILCYASGKYSISCKTAS